MKKVLISFCLIFISSLFLTGQITQTGTLNGTVYDHEKHVLPGVTVTIKSPALILPQMDTLTTERGTFRFPALPPGDYTVTFKIPGFKTVVREGIKVTVGVTTTLEITLEQAPIEESITVIGQSPTVDIQRTMRTVSLTKEVLQNLPAARTLSAYFHLAPGVTGGTVHGSSERDNTFNIDGVNVTDPVTGTSAGGFSIDIMEELSVQTGGLPAEYGSVRGGVVNVITKSGGNRFSGSLIGFFRNKDLQSTNTKGTIFEGQVGGFDYEFEPSVTLGGPIIKDKIWFFLTGTIRKSQEFVLGYPWDTPGQNTPLDFYYPMPYGKISWQLSRKDRVFFSYNYYDFIRNHRGASAFRTVDSTWKQTTPIYTYNFQWTRLFSPSFLMNFKFGRLDYHLNLMAKNNKVQMYDAATSRFSQSYGYDDIYTRDRVQALVDATYFVDNWLGTHELKLGVEYENSWDVRNWRSNYDEYGFGPLFYYNSASIPIAPATRSDTYMLHYDNFARRDKKIAISGFIQDSWNPHPRLSLNLGLRFDRQEGILPKQGMERQPITFGGKVYDPRLLKTVKPMIWNTFAPRLGGVFDVFGDGKTALKVSFSRYYIANILQFFVTVNPNSFITWRVRYNVDQPTGKWQPVPSTSEWYMYMFSATADAVMDPDVKCPYLDEFIIGIERELVADMKLGVRYIRKWDRNLIEGVNLNALNYDLYKTGHIDILDPAVWRIFAPRTVTDTWYNETVTFWNLTDTAIASKPFYTNPPGAKRDYDGVEISLDKRFSNRWSLSTSFVWQKSRGLIGTDFDDSWTGTSYFDNPNAHVNAVGRFPLEREFQLKINGMWQGPWGILISGYYRYLDGTRWTRVIRSGDLGLTLAQGTTTIFAERRGRRKLPALSMLDMRVEKSFRLPRKFGTVGLFADIFNVFNVAIPTSVWTRSSSTGTVGGKIVRFGDLTAITDPRIFRLGFRFQF